MKKWIRVTALLLAAALSLSMTAFAAETTPVFHIEAEAETVDVGDTVEVTISVTDNPGIACVIYEVAYDTALLSCGEQDVQLERILTDGGFAYAVNPDYNGRLRIVATSAYDTQENGPLFTLRFHALKAGTSAITLEVEEVVSNLEDIDFRDDSTSVTVQGGTQSGSAAQERPSQNEGAEAKPTQQPAKSAFVDVSEDAWYYSSVQYVVDKGLFSGISDDRFAPDDSMTRGMFVTVLYRLAGSPAAGRAAFTDVSDSDWYAVSVAWANANGIVGGVGNGLFAPNQPITREQLALILYQYAKGTSPGTEGLFRTFYPDGREISDWALTAMAWAVDQGILSGKTGNQLDPKGTATRAEAATMLMRLSQQGQS